MISILKNREFYFSSKYFNNQNLSQDSRNSGEFFWDIIFRKFFSNLVKLQKNNKDLRFELRANNEILLAEKRQWTLFSSIL